MSTLTELILETFKLNGELLTAGNMLVAPLGLTSARWQVMGAISMAASPLPVAHIARNMGLSRQAVQRTVNDLVALKLVQLSLNPHHQRAQLVLLTKKGEAVVASAAELQRPWVDDLAIGLSARDIAVAHSVISSLRTKLQSRNKSQLMESGNVEEFA